jgi:hypothetical protein
MAPVVLVIRSGHSLCSKLAAMLFDFEALNADVPMNLHQNQSFKDLVRYLSRTLIQDVAYAQHGGHLERSMLRSATFLFEPFAVGANPFLTPEFAEFST